MIVLKLAVGTVAPNPQNPEPAGFDVHGWAVREYLVLALR